MTEGMKSSELIVTLVVLAIIVVNKWLGLGLDPTSLWAIVGSGGAFTVSRGVAKMNTPSARRAADPTTPDPSPDPTPSATTPSRRAAR